MTMITCVCASDRSQCVVGKNKIRNQTKSVTERVRVLNELMKRVMFAFLFYIIVSIK